MLAGLVVLTVLDITAFVYLRHNISSAVALIGAVSTPSVAIVSAYFGIKAGARSGATAAAVADKARQQSDLARQQSDLDRRQSETDRQRLDDQLKVALGHLNPGDAKDIMAAIGLQKLA